MISTWYFLFMVQRLLSKRNSIQLWVEVNKISSVKIPENPQLFFFSWITFLPFLLYYFFILFFLLFYLQRIICSKSRLGVTRIQDLSHTDMKKVRQLALIDMTALCDLIGLEVKRHKTAKRKLPGMASPRHMHTPTQRKCVKDLHWQHEENSWHCLSTSQLKLEQDNVTFKLPAQCFFSDSP